MYVNDLLITRMTLTIAQIKHPLLSAFTIKDLGLSRYFPRIEISRPEEGAFLNQRKYILNIHAKIGLREAKFTKFLSL